MMLWYDRFDRATVRAVQWYRFWRLVGRIWSFRLLAEAIGVSTFGLLAVLYGALAAGCVALIAWQQFDVLRVVGWVLAAYIAGLVLSGLTYWRSASRLRWKFTISVMFANTDEWRRLDSGLRQQPGPTDLLTLIQAGRDSEMVTSYIRIYLRAHHELAGSTTACGQLTQGTRQRMVSAATTAAESIKQTLNGGTGTSR